VDARLSSDSLCCDDISGHCSLHSDFHGCISVQVRPTGARLTNVANTGTAQSNRTGYSPGFQVVAVEKNGESCLHSASCLVCSTLWTLRVSLNKRLEAIALLAVGFIATILTCVRAYFFWRLLKGSNNSWQAHPAYITGILELNLDIVSLWLVSNDMLLRNDSRYVPVLHTSVSLQKVGWNR
jgi:hypothetical protein